MMFMRSPENYANLQGAGYKTSGEIKLSTQHIIFTVFSEDPACLSTPELEETPRNIFQEIERIFSGSVHVLFRWNLRAGIEESEDLVQKILRRKCCFSCFYRMKYSTKYWPPDNLHFFEKIERSVMNE